MGAEKTAVADRRYINGRHYISQFSIDAPRLYSNARLPLRYIHLNL
jgi:hypothetical protein